MVLVSKAWQRDMDQKDKEVYEYLSLRDRECYDILCKKWKSVRDLAIKEEKEGGPGLPKHLP